MVVAVGRLVCRPALSLTLAPLSNYVQDSTDDDYDRWVVDRETELRAVMCCCGVG